jgi:hypothetical protein
MLALAVLRLFDPRALRARSPELWLSLATLLLYTYFTSSFAYASWGWTTGPRHLTSLIPFLLLPLALFLRSLTRYPGGGRGPGSAWWQVVSGGVAAALLFLSILTTSVMTFLNYISDALTNGLHQVALPMALRGFLPHNWLSLMGVPNPWAALPAVLVVLAAATICAAVVIRLLTSGRRLPALVIAMAVAAALMTAHASVRPRKDRVARELQSVGFMSAIYVPRPHQAPPRLWSHGGRSP